MNEDNPAALEGRKVIRAQRPCAPIFLTAFPAFETATLPWPPDSSDFGRVPTRTDRTVAVSGVGVSELSVDREMRSSGRSPWTSWPFGDKLGSRARPVEGYEPLVDSGPWMVGREKSR